MYTHKRELQKLVRKNRNIISEKYSYLYISFVFIPTQ